MANPAKILERGTDGIAFEALIPASQPGDVFPAGTVVDYAGSSAPTGWLICDGSNVSRATYPQLFANIGTTFGAGDGSTTFGIPDARGKSSVGKHTSGTFTTLGASGGEENHLLSAAEMPVHAHAGPSHAHTFTPAGTISTGGAHTHAPPSGGIFYTNGGSISDSIQTGTSGSFFDLRGFGNSSTTSAGSHNHTFTGSGGTTAAAGTGNTGNAGSGSTHNNMHPYIVLNKIIRAY